MKNKQILYCYSCDRSNEINHKAKAKQCQHCGYPILRKKRAKPTVQYLAR